MELRPNKTKPYKFPKKVLECGGDGSIERVEGSAAYRCVAKDSDKLHRERLYYFVSKKALNIDGVGPRIIDALLDNNLISTYVDLFTLEEGDLIDLPSFKEKAAINVIEAVNSSREVPLHRLLVGLSINHVGDETARIIADKFITLDGVKSANVEELSVVDGVGDIVAASVYEWMSNKDNTKMLNELLEQIAVVSPEINKSKKLDGKIFVFTGTLPNYGRSEAQELAREHGAHISNSVSANTNYVVAGGKPGSKEKKAKELGVLVIDEEDFKKLL